jgi:hypothetical protein
MLTTAQAGLQARQFAAFLIAQVLGYRRFGYGAQKPIRRVWTRRSFGRGASMWDQLSPADFRRARHVLNLRRADTLKRHTKEIAELLM